MAIIYKATNKVSGKKYIGQTGRDLSDRIKQHCLDSSPCLAFSRAIKKYKLESFEWVILYETDDPFTLNFMENYYIAKYDTLAPNGYNLNTGGGKSFIVSDETRRRMSESAKKVPSAVKQQNALGNRNRLGKKASDETKHKMSVSHKGKILSDETKQKISTANKGRKRKPFSEETKRKMSVAQRGNKNAKKLAISS